MGRPDLRASLGWAAEDLAGMLYDSLHGKLLALPDATLVYPAHGAGYDSNTNTLIVFGGTDCNGGYLNDVWVLSNPDGAGAMVWRELRTTGPPPAGRENAGVTYDVNTGVLIVFGGDSGNTTLYNDAWLLTHANGEGGTPAWLKLEPSRSLPPARTNAPVAYNPSSNSLMVCTGKGSSGALADCWSLSGADGMGVAAWSQVVATGVEVPPRDGATAIDANGDVVLFGGHVTTEEFSPSDDHSYMLMSPNDDEGDTAGRRTAEFEGDRTTRIAALRPAPARPDSRRQHI